MNSLLYYQICFVASILLSFIFICLWHDGIDVNITCLFILIPIVTLGCIWMYRAPNLELAIVSNKLVYIAGCFWPLISTKAILSLCNLKIKKIYTVIAFAISFVFYGFALFTDKPGALYKSIDYLVIDGRVELYPEYGWMHTVIYAAMVIYILVGVVALFYAMKNTLRASIRNMRIMLLGEIATIIGFFIYGMQKLAGSPAILYVMSQAIILVAGYRSYYYDIDSSVMDTIVVEGTLGYVTFDMKKRLLGCNEVAEQYFPELKSTRTDMPLDNLNGIKKDISECIDYVEANHKAIEKIIPCQGKAISMKVDEYLLRGKMKSYRIMFSDDTDHQNLISLLNKEKEAAKEETKHVTDTFNRYVDPNIADKILHNRENAGDASEKNIAVLFADIRGFTTFSENKAPKDVLRMLNLIIETITSCIKGSDGIVDKFIGDCVMAIWSSESQEDCVFKSCKAALDIQDALAELGDRTEKEFGIRLCVGIGINYGPAIVGNVGTIKRSDYTAIGDTVNVASRLEGLAQPGEILVTSNLADMLKGKAIFKANDQGVMLKGRSSETTVLKLEKLI